MLPFLRNTTNRLELYLRDNNDINTECFELVISTLNGKPVKGLHFGGCNITDISSLETYNLPNIEELSLSKNNIGREGIMILSFAKRRLNIDTPFPNRNEFR